MCWWKQEYIRWRKFHGGWKWIRPHNKQTDNGWSRTLEKRTLVMVDSVESIPPIPTRLVKRLPRFFSLSFYFFVLFFMLSLPVFFITAPLCHRHGWKWPPSLWPSITGHNHLRQVLSYSNKPSPQCCPSFKVPVRAPKWLSSVLIRCCGHSWLGAGGWLCAEKKKKFIYIYRDR